MEIKEKITSRFNKSKFELLNCGTADDGDWAGVDEYIRDFIVQLNKCEHISTLYSCEGHYEKDDAYLYFGVNEIGWDIFWQKVMPELSMKFCLEHPEVSGVLYNLQWLVSTTNNQYNSGINISSILTNYAVEETGRIITTWENKKEIFWNSMKETFLKYYK